MPTASACCADDFGYLTAQRPVTTVGNLVVEFIW
jgi:hypothetical protein